MKKHFFKYEKKRKTLFESSPKVFPLWFIVFPESSSVQTNGYKCFFKKIFIDGTLRNLRKYKIKLICDYKTRFHIGHANRDSKQ